MCERGCVIESRVTGSMIGCVTEGVRGEVRVCERGCDRICEIVS